MVATKPVSATHTDRSLEVFDPELAKAIQLEQRRHDSLTRVIFRRDQLDMLFLASLLDLNCLGELRVEHLQ